MKELKTLKDLETQDYCSDGKTLQGTGLIDMYYLKQEAIKWDKKLADDDFRKAVWRTFFNITEEDLEEKGA